MAVVNIKGLAKALENSPTGRELVYNGMSVLLYVLEAQKLLDFRMIQKATLDWDKGTLSLGDNTLNMILGRALSQYAIDRRKKAFMYAIDMSKMPKE